MDEAKKATIGAALGRIPSGLFILTAQHEDRRHGQLTSWVQQLCFKPPMVAVAKGRGIMPLISESGQFGLCQLGDEQKIIFRKFSNELDSTEDPFLGFDLTYGEVLRVPILVQSIACMECELTRHMDVDGDHDLFVGRVKGAGVRGGTPHIHLRENGFDY